MKFGANKRAGYVAAAFAVAGVALIYHSLLNVNPTTVALTFLVEVLVVSAIWGLRHAVLTSVLATLAFNYFFLPPIGTFTIADPQNWAALVAFLITAVVASELSDRARREARNANERRAEVERLYSFSQLLLSSEKLAELLNLIPRYLVESFGFKAAAIFLANRSDIYRSSPANDGLEAHDLQLASLRGELKIIPASGLAFLPLRMGVRSVGSLGIVGLSPSRQTLEAMGSLIAIAIERAGTIEKLGRAEASRESEQLRTALLDSVTHEFRTPLTSIKASVTTLLGSGGLDPSQQHELLSVINEESDRLNRLVGEAAKMAQLDAENIQFSLEPNSVSQAIEDAIHAAESLLGRRSVEMHVPANLPNGRFDPDGIKEVMHQLLQNAAKYSGPDAPVHITAEEKNGMITVSVADRGPGIDDFEQSLIFDKFYRGHNHRFQVQGTGMGLAIARSIVEAHGGHIGVTSQPGHGSVFYFTLPAA